MKNKVEEIQNYLEELYPEAKCELNYKKDYELLIATVLSAQCTDKRVNQVTTVLWEKYSLESLAKAPKKDVEKIIHSLGSSNKKAECSCEPETEDIIFMLSNLTYAKEQINKIFFSLLKIVISGF